MIVLIFLLIVGLGMIIKGLFQIIIGVNQKKTNNIGGGFVLNQSIGWLKLSIISFIGIVIGLMLLSFIAPYGIYGTSMTGMNTNSGNSMVTSSTGNMASHSSSNTTGNMNSSNTQMGNMSTPVIQTGVSSANINDIMQTLNQMQIQINQLQQQMNSGGSSGGSTGGSSGGMGMM